ncbi:MAG: DUF3488 and DUF4129 domain-containing transglutaminase family protein [Terriglobales bacterium]
MPAATSLDAVERYFQLSLYLLITAGFATVVSTGKLDLLTILLVTAALLVRGYLLVGGREFALEERWTAPLTLVYVLFYAIDYFLISREFVAATVHLVLFVMVVKIFSVQRDRDYLYLAVLAFLEVLAASVLTVDAVFLAVFAIFVLLAVNTCIALEIRRSARSALARSRDSAGHARRLPRSLFGVALALVTGILVTGAALFFVLPRVTAGYLSTLAPRHSDIVSGFSNSVNLGNIGQIQQLDAVVMHVQPERGNGPTHDLLLRGVSLGLFDGKRWTNPIDEPVRLQSRTGEFNLFPLYATWQDTPVAGGPVKSLRYRVLMEPIGSNVFFVAPKPAFLLGNYREITADRGGALYNSDVQRSVGLYEFVSAETRRRPQELRTATAEYPPGVELRYLQLPQQFDERVQALAEQVTARFADNYDKAAAIESYLSTTFGYTLQLPARTPADPIADFLFTRKQGHCEYFASAMAIMLRTIGIPSRVVNGFRGGEFNPISGSYIVRARDAHSWVEAYFPPAGWVTFDPTPAGAAPATAGLWSRFQLYLDAGREFWREWVINYDFSHQRSLSMAAVIRGRRTGERLRDWVRERYAAVLRVAIRGQESLQRSPQAWAGVTVASVALLVVALNLRRFRRALVRFQLTRHPASAPPSAAGLWYARLLRVLARRGWHKPPSKTPAEFLAAIDDPAVRRAVADFTVHYERARFGNSAADAQRLPELFETVRRS